MEAFAVIDELKGGLVNIQRILVITYVVGSFVFQLTAPKWRRSNRHQDMPAQVFKPIGDTKSISIWPNARTARWPPRTQLSRSTLEDFRERFRRVVVIRRR